MHCVTVAAVLTLKVMLLYALCKICITKIGSSALNTDNVKWCPTSHTIEYMMYTFKMLDGFPKIIEENKLSIIVYCSKALTRPLKVKLTY